MPNDKLTQSFLLPELKFLDFTKNYKNGVLFTAEKKSDFEVCPNCGNKSSNIHDRRWVKIKDEPFRGNEVYLRLLKRRFRCINLKCKKVFTEPIPGILKSGKVTQRLERHLFDSCESYQSIKKVKEKTKCGYKLIYRSYYRQLELKAREKRDDPWPKTIGIDEHGFNKDKKRGARNFATLIVDYDNKRAKEIIQGKSHEKLFEGLSYIRGRDRVKNAVIDLSDSYKSFIKKFFPNANIIADKFHVLRLINPILTRKRIDITGDVRSHFIRKLLLKKEENLHFEERIELNQWLRDNPDLKEAYIAKRKLYTVYNCRGFNKAKISLINLIDFLKKSNQPELLKLGRTLLKWSKEILRYFATKITNARTESFNNTAKLVQKRAYGYKSFPNYRLRILNACR